MVKKWKQPTLDGFGGSKVNGNGSQYEYGCVNA